jgi:hypothetical protein
MAITDAHPGFAPQALELDRRNVDAYVARGAALANQKQWQEAMAALNVALGRCSIAPDVKLPQLSIMDSQLRG